MSDRSPAPLPFAEVTRRTQIERMRRGAETVLTQYGIAPSKLRLLNHDYNTTFRVETAHGPFALRINLNSTRPPEQVEAEVSWVAALVSETDIVVPSPQPLTDGGLVARVRIVGVGRELPAVLFSWLDGPDLGERATLRQVREMGAMTARLHAHGERWRSSASIAIPQIASVFMDSPDALNGEVASTWDGETRAVLAEARQRIDELLRPVFTGPTHVIHGDIHLWNTKWHDDQIAVFDFEDCGLGVALQDVAISAYYLRDRPRHEAALLEGYAAERSLPDHTPEQFEALLASRNLLLLNDVLGNVTAGMADFLPGYAARTVSRLRHWLDTGSFSLDPPS